MATSTSSGSGTWPPAARSGRRPGHRAAIGDAVFTPDGRSLVTVSEDRTLRFWDPATGAEIRQIEASDERIWFASLSADGKTLATGGGLRPTRLWDVASGRMLREFSVPGEHFTWCGDLSPDGKTLATSEDNGVIFWDTATGRRRVARGRPTSDRESHMIKALRFAPDGKSVATIGGDWVRFWDVATAEETRRFALPNKGRLDGFMLDGARLAYSPDGTILAATSKRDGRIFLLDAAIGPRARPPRRAREPVQGPGVLARRQDPRHGHRHRQTRRAARAGDPALGRGRTEGAGPRPGAPRVHPRPGLLPRRPAAGLGERGRHGPGLGRGPDRRPAGCGRRTARFDHTRELISTIPKKVYHPPDRRGLLQ